MAYWCPGCQKGGREPRGVEGSSDALASSLRHAPPLLPRRVRVLPRRRPAVLLRGARNVRPPDPLRVPPARARLHRGARRPALHARRRARGRRRSAARAGCARSSPARTRARHPTRTRRSTGACSCRCSSAPRKAAAASTGTTARSTARTGSSRSRSSRGPRIRRGRAARRHLVRPADRARRRHPRSRRRDRRAAAMWPEAQGLLPRDYGREPDRLCVLELEQLASGEEAPDAPGELADAVTALRLATARRSPPDRCSSSASTGVRTGFARCCRSRRRRRPASRRGSTRSARRSPQNCARYSRRRRGREARRRARPLGALALPGRPVPRRAAAPRARLARSATARALGGGDARGSPPRRDPKERARLVERAREPTADLVRRLLVAVLLHGNRRALLRDLDATLLGSERVAQLRAS